MVIKKVCVFVLFSMLFLSCESKAKTNSNEELSNQAKQAKVTTENKKIMKSLEELINKNEPGWDIVKELSANAKNHYVFLPKDTKRAETELVNSQVTTRSPMGSVIYETGGIFIDHGWIRVLGSGSPDFDRGLMSWNKGKSFGEYGDQSSFLLIADDVIGGFFAINAGHFGDDIGKIYYLAPETLAWESLGLGYTEFLNWLFNGDIQMFYEPYRWKTWKEDIKNVTGNQAMSFYPFLWTKEGKDIEAADKKIVPVEEIYTLTLEMQNQIKAK